MTTPPATSGLLAEFADAESLLAGIRTVRERGYRHVDACTPYPVEGCAEALGFHRTRMPLVVLVGGLIGLAAGFGLQWWVSVVAYPLNIGGRPLNSWPSFIPVTFEVTVLVAGLFAVLGMLGLNGLPRPHHPLFAVEAFQRATSDRFFLWIAADDPQFHETTTRTLLDSLHPLAIHDVPAEPE